MKRKPTNDINVDRQNKDMILFNYFKVEFSARK